MPSFVLENAVKGDTAFLKNEIAKWAKIARIAGMKAE